MATTFRFSASTSRKSVDLVYLDPPFNYTSSGETKETEPPPAVDGGDSVISLTQRVREPASTHRAQRTHAEVPEGGMRGKRTTNEWEFQGEVLDWLNSEIRRRRGIGLDKVTQEPSKITAKRNDLVVWTNRAAESAFLTIELKTPKTPLTDSGFLSDADLKARRWGAPFFALWNMQAAELYRTPAASQAATPQDRICAWPPDPLVLAVEDWLKPRAAVSLRTRAIEIFDRAWVKSVAGSAHALTIDASVFVERLAQSLTHIRAYIQSALTAKAARNRSVRQQLRAVAAAQGFLGFVEDMDAAIAGQYAYRLVGQILFYFALRRRQPSLRPLVLSSADDLPSAFRPFWDDVRRFDYEALFQPSPLDNLVPLPRPAQALLRALVADWAAYDWNSIRDDVLGAVFEQLIPQEEQSLLGQFYTPSRVADVLVAFTVDGDAPVVLDPGCGSGTFLMRAYDFLKTVTGQDHGNLLSGLWGIDISPFAAELAAINLFRQDMTAFDNFPRIIAGNFFDRRPGEEIPFPPARAGGQEKVTVQLQPVSAVVGNPPYLRSQNQDDLDPQYKTILMRCAAANRVPRTTKSDLFAFFIYKALEFLKPGSRLGFVTAASWLSTDYGAPLQWLLLDRLRLVAVIGSTAESFFSQVDINTILLVAEMRDEPGVHEGEQLRFVMLKKPLEELFATGPGYWSSVVAFADRVEQSPTSLEELTVRVKLVDARKERNALAVSPKRPRNWSAFLRAPMSHEELLGEGTEWSCSLQSLGRVGLGYKSLQNEFFYVTERVSKRYQIEGRFLRPIFRLKDLDGERFFQTGKPGQQLFYCKLPEGDIRGTGALNYIHDMAKRAAVRKKQAGRLQTIEEALSAQSGKCWYAPKAQPHESHIWLRKALDVVYAPFLSQKGVVVDQRCNFVTTGPEIEWEVVAAVLTSSVFALAVESVGAASLGAGALELPTAKLRELRVFDARRLTAAERQELRQMAAAVWENEAPVDWQVMDTPGPRLETLDAWLLKRMGGAVSLERLYADITDTCRARLRIAADKTARARKVLRQDIEEVAGTIAAGIAPLIEGKRFPEAFYRQRSEVVPLDFSAHRLLIVRCDPIMTIASVTVSDGGTGGVVLEKQYPREVAQVLLRALLMGRQQFDLPVEPEAAREALGELKGWLPALLAKIDEGCRACALGTRFEDEVRRGVMQRLGFHEQPTEGECLGEFRLTKAPRATMVRDEGGAQLAAETTAKYGRAHAKAKRRG